MESSAPGEADRALRALKAHRFLMRLALGAGNIFAWVFVFRGFFIMSGSFERALAGVALLYALSQAIAFVITPLSGAALRHGIRRSLVYGTLMAAFAFVCLSLIFVPQASTLDFAFSMIASFVILMGMHRAIYWIPYRAAEAELHATRTPLSTVRETAVVLMPAFAGILIAYPGGARMLLAFVSGMIVLSVFPLTMIEEAYEGFSWDFRETLVQLFSPFNRDSLVLSVLDGIQGVTLLLLWPLAAFLILGQSFTALGIILSLTLALTFAGRSVVRGTLKRLRADRSTTVIAIIAFSSWILRLGAATPVQLFLVDIYYHSGISPRRFSVEASLFDQTADGGHYVDEFTALKEMGLAIGRVFACLIFAILALAGNAPLALAFAIIFAAISAAASVVLSRRLTKRV